VVADPAEARTIPAMVRAAAAAYGDAEALVDGDLRLSFTELGEWVDHAAAAAAARSVNPGDRVAIWAPNVWQWVIAALGVSAAGGVLVPINTRFKADEAQYIIDKSGAQLVLTVGEFLGVNYQEMCGGLLLDDFLATAAPASRMDLATPESLSDVIFTSGTTGKPKGVMATHAQTTRVFADWSGILGLRYGDRYLIVNPFFHTFGYKAGFVAAIMRGATIVPHAVFEPVSVMQRVAEERITMLPGPPALHQQMLDHPDRGNYDLSSLRLCATGAAVIPVEMIRRMRQELSYESIITAYGLTEATGTATMCRPEDDAETIATTSGRALPDVEVRIAGDGEILVRGYNVTQGYLDDPEATAEAIDAVGWLHTGDIGTMDDRGYIKITDRKKDMFIVGGFNAYPAEIEQVLVQHPSVSQAAVVGMPDERLGEVGRAFVVLRPGQTIDEDEVIAWCRERIANYKVPRRVEVVDALPLNASGKVLKYVLRDRASAREPVPDGAWGRSPQEVEKP
jgi:acyl-CoA synthetase (AMP-forming)/AMP-acid ligase II